VKPHLGNLWDDQWENRWWPQGLKGKQAFAAPRQASGAEMRAGK
jgi:hypothetical protein